MNRKAQMPISEVIALIIAVIILFVGIVLAVYFTKSGSSLSADIVNALSFNWLFGKI